jgi:hypothetical protein
VATVQIAKGILAGLDLETIDEAELHEFAHAADQPELNRRSFYAGEIKRETFRGVTFSECSFARAKFEEVVFRRCVFRRVDLIRVRFVNCHFSDCQFRACDPYYPSFSRTVVSPFYFKHCYDKHDWNKALILFEKLKLGFEKAGNGRLARAADYYYRIGERRRLYYLWRDRGTSGPIPAGELVYRFAHGVWGTAGIPRCLDVRTNHSDELCLSTLVPFRPYTT